MVLPLLLQVLIVAKCNVNILAPVKYSRLNIVLIVAKCNVNGEVLEVDETYFAY